MAGVSLQAREAARSTRDLALRAGLLAQLARRPRWLAGVALKLSSWPLQGLALLLAPLTLVRPALAAGLIVLVAIGHRAGGRRVDRGEWAAVAAIVAGVAGVAASAPSRSDIHAGPAHLAGVMGGLALLILVPVALRSIRRPSAIAVIGAAGLAAAWSGLATKLAADDVARGDWAGFAFWTAGTGTAALVGLLNELTALQTRRPTQVVPAMLVLQMAVPVALAPWLTGESWTTAPAAGVPLAVALCVVTAGIVTLARRPEVAAVAVSPGADPGHHGCPPPDAAPGWRGPGRTVGSSEEDDDDQTG